MRVVIKIDFSDEERRALRHRIGKKGLATRKELCRETELTIRSVLEGFTQDMLNENESSTKTEET